MERRRALGRVVPMTATPDPTVPNPSVHPHRITVVDVPGTVRIEIGGVTIAQSSAARVLQEGSLPPRYYLPREDVRTDLLVATESSTTCPFKGAASYWTLELDGRRYEDIVWSYETPIPEMAEITGLLSFYNERVDVVLVDGSPTGDVIES
jgi:uncharacterized protein (DUF427 family)